MTKVIEVKENLLAKYMNADDLEKIKQYDTVSEMWQNIAAQYADAVAISDDGVDYTFATLNDDAMRFGAVLSSKGLKKGDTVAILAPNSYEFVKVYIAATVCGYVAAILPAHLDAGSVFGCCYKFGAKALVYAPALQEKTSVLAQRLPNVALVSAAETSDVTAQPAKLVKTDGCVIMFTGGTTGKSKGALLSHGAVAQGTINGCYGLKDIFGQRYLLVLPLSHVFGLIRNLMTSLYTGSTMFICRNNKDMFRDIAVFRPTVLVIVPAIAEMALTLSAKFKRNMLGDSLKYIICGAAPVPPYLIAEYKKLGILLFPGYGLTESANLVSGNAECQTKPASVGLPYPGQKLKIVDGELWLKGPNMMTCYVGDEEENAKAYDDGWFKTGDLVRVDDDGFLYIVGRIKEVIILSSGENVSPAEVEAKFNELDVVQDCQLFEDIAENGTHFLALEVVPRAVKLAQVEAEDKNAYLMQQLNAVNNSLPPFERAAKITIRTTDFERTPSMKILRYKKCN